ncbi:hypothetical protein B0H19DRAFT_917321 [Mycena capillaripes]|nr:hypothetical protein B0H19DRAFT_917321 [Mycena capillaripes]
MHRGPGRASFMWGSSTRNTRIERLWVEVGTQFARRWRAFFTQWNLHPLSGRLTSDQSPADIRFLGQLTEGVYRHDPLDGIHPDAINRYYGVAGRRLRRSRNRTGAGISSDDEAEEDDNDDEHEPNVEEQLENQVQADLVQNIRHQPVKVAKHRSPFKDEELEDHFLSLLEDLLAQPAVLPEDYGILEDEWEEDDYPEIEIIRPGTKGKELAVILPRAEWFPRAARWAQGLDLMTRVLHELEDETDSSSSTISYDSNDSD